MEQVHSLFQSIRVISFVHYFLFGAAVLGYFGTREQVLERELVDLGASNFYAPKK